MKTIKGWIPTGILTAALLVSATAANAGVITGGLTTEPTDPCTADQKIDYKKIDSGVITGGITGVITGGLTGVITGGFTGVITGGFTGIIVVDFKGDTPVNCGVITGG